MKSLRVCTLLLGLCAASAWAEQVAVPVFGISGANVVWGDANGGIDNGSFRVEDAHLVSPFREDAFDGLGTITVNATNFDAPSGLVTVEGNKVTAGPTTIFGLNVTIEYLFDTKTATWRHVVFLKNPTNADISTTVRYSGNLGSDNSTVIRASSSGDTTFTAADRWAISADNANDANISDPVVTIVFFGPGTPAVPITTVNTAHGATQDNLDVGYNVTVPAGQTRSLLFFVQLNESGAAATQAVTTFDTTTALLDAGLLTGFTRTQLGQILNWDMTAALAASANARTFVFEDVNGNGLQDAGEQGMSNVTVRFKSTDGTVIQSVDTDSAGFAEFAIAPAGTYTLDVERVSGYRIAAKDQGTDDNVDSDFSPASATASITIANGSTARADAGFIAVVPFAFGADASKIYRVNPVSGRTAVLLNDTGGRRVTGLAVDPTSGTLFAVTGNTGTNTNTLFTVNKTTGALTMVAALTGVTQINDIAFNTAGQLFGFSKGNQDLNTIDKATAVVTQVADSTLTNTFGNGLAIRADGTGFVAPFGNVGDLLTINLSTGLTTVVAKLTGSPVAVQNSSISALAFSPQGILFGTTNYTNGNNESFLITIDQTTAAMTTLGALPASFDALCFDAGTGAAASAFVGGKVWNDTNGDGILGNGETLVDGVTVNLLRSGEIVASTTSNSSGYGFTVVPDTYVVEFLQNGVFVSKKDQGTDDNVDSDADPGTGRTAAITLTASQSLSNVSAGVQLAATIGNFAWNDLNSNGIKDQLEAGVKGVLVKLINESGAIVDTTTTDADGFYSFTSVDPRVKYVVQFTPPSSMAITLKDQGADDAADSDADQVTGKTALITLTSGQPNLTIDVGLVTPVFPTVTSPASASNTTPITGETVTFSVSATDPNGATLTVTWDFGDGTTGTGATTTHVYTAPGVYTATAIINNGSVGGTTTSSQTVIVGALPLVINKVGIKLSFSKPNSDSIGFAGVMPAQAGQAIASQTATVNFGGVTKTFNLDAKGGAKSGKDSMKVGIKGTNAQNAKFSVKLTGDFKTQLADEGFNNADNKAKPILVAVSITVGTKVFATTTQIFYTSKAQSGGAAKSLRLP